MSRPLVRALSSVLYATTTLRVSTRYAEQFVRCLSVDVLYSGVLTTL